MVRKVFLMAVVVLVILALAATIFTYWFFSGDGMRQAIAQQATAWLGQPVQIGRARAQLFPRIGIRLREVSVGDPARLSLSDVQLSTDLGALFKRHIEDARLIVSDSRIQMPLPFDIPGGSSSPSTEAARPALEVVSIREIALRNIAVVSRDRQVLVSADSTLEGDHLTLRRFTAQSSGTSLEVTGEVDLEPRIDARLEATANEVDLDELVALAAAFAPERPTGAHRSTTPSARIAAHIAADAAKAGGVKVTQLAADLEATDDRVVLSPMSFLLFGGQYQGSLSARLGGTLAVTLQSRLKDVDVAQLAAFGGSPDSVTGKLSGTGSFSAQGNDFGDILPKAAGKGSISIVKGTIRRLNLVRTVVLFLGRPAPDSKAASDEFDRMDASFSLARQVVRADPFTLNSRDADIAGAGTLTLGDKALDGTLTLTLSEELSAQAGSDLIRYAHEGNRVVLPARIGGTLSEPRISIDASAAVKRGLKNEIQRRLGGFLDRFKGGDNPQK